MVDYTLSWSDDSLKAPFTLAGETLDGTTTSLTLTGHGYVNWGEPQQENLLHLLENFASNGVQPSNPTEGQLWFDASDGYINIYYNGTWQQLGYRRIDAVTAPAGPSYPGDLWYDTINNLLKVYTVGDTWVSVCSQCGSSPVSPSPSPVSPSPVSPTPTPVSAPLAFRSEAHAVLTGGNSVTLQVPPGTAAGDMLIAFIGVASGSSVDLNIGTSPAGWGVLDEASGLGLTAYNAFTFWKIAGSSEPSSYTWTFVGGSATISYAGGQMLCYTGGSGTPAIDAHGELDNASGTAVTAPAIYCTASSGVLVYLGVIRSNSSFTQASGFTERGDFFSVGGGGTISLTTADTAYTPGSTGSVTATATTSQYNSGFLIAISGVGAVTPSPSPNSGSSSSISNPDAVGSSLEVASNSSHDFTLTYTGTTIGDVVPYSISYRNGASDTAPIISTQSGTIVRTNGNSVTKTFNMGTLGGGDTTRWMTSQINGVLSTNHIVIFITS